MRFPRPSSTAGYVCLVAGLIAPFVLPFGAHVVVGLVLCSAGILFIASGADGRRGRPPRDATRRRAARPRV